MTNYEGTIRTARVEIGLFCDDILKLDDDRERIVDALRFLDNYGGLKAPADGPDYLDDLIGNLNSAFAQAADVAHTLYDASTGMTEADFAATN